MKGIGNNEIKFKENWISIEEKKHSILKNFHNFENKSYVEERSFHASIFIATFLLFSVLFVCCSPY